MLLSFIIFIPIVGALFLTFLPQGKKQIFRYAMLFFQLLVLVGGLYLAFSFDTQHVGYQFGSEFYFI